MKIDPQNGLHCGVFCRVVDLPERGASRGRALTDPLSSSERCFFDIMGRGTGCGFQMAFSRRNPQKCKLYGTWQGLSPKIPENSSDAPGMLLILGGFLVVLLLRRKWYNLVQRQTFIR